MGSRLSGFGKALYDPKRREFLGRDGARWAKLSIFYFFFYLGLAGFFCAMLAVFMALSPRDRPRYYSEDSTMKTRSNPLSPGLGFRPQPQAEKNLIIVNRDIDNKQDNPYVKNLDQYLSVYYWKDDKAAKQKDNGAPSNGQSTEGPSKHRKFRINDPGECTGDQQYGFGLGRPCVLVKMNKIVGFEPIPGSQSDETDAYKACQAKQDDIPVFCYGENPADADSLGNISYKSENSVDTKCGALDKGRFPYEGKYDRTDFYQAPYVWVQFMKPTPNVLINVICRVYGSNIEFDKKAGRALTRFQLYVKDLRNADQSSSKAGEI